MTRAYLPLVAASLAASTAFTAPTALHAEEAVALPAPLAASASPEGTLRRFSAGSDALTFWGENGSREFPVYVSAADTASMARIVLSVTSAVSDLPEASEMTVLVNDRPVGKSRLGETDGTELAFDLPAGLLQPGFNAVSITVAQEHRVDCSVAATYELWTRIDPLRSGIRFGVASATPHDFADLAGVERNLSGQFVIRGRVAPDASTRSIEQTLSAIQSFVVATGIDRPLVDFNELPGTGPGIDVVVGSSRGSVSAQSGTGLPFLSFTPGSAETRPTLFVSGASSDELGTNLAQLASFAQSAQVPGSAEGLRALSIRSGRMLEAGQKVEIGSLGFHETHFPGRFYHDRIDFNLPADFYAADYGDAAIYLDAAYAPNLLKSAQFFVRANGAIVSTLGLSSFKGGTLSRQGLPIPLSKLRPGRNSVTFEATLPSAADEVCDTGLHAALEPRLFVSGKTTLEIPTLARVGHAPDIAATTAGLSQINAPSRVSAFLPTPAGPALDAAGTFFATLAASADKVMPVEIVSSVPAQTTGEVIAFGTLPELPPSLLSYVGLGKNGVTIDPAGGERAGSVEGKRDGAGDPPDKLFSRVGEWLGVSPAQAANGQVPAVFSEPFDLSDRLAEMRTSAETLGQSTLDWAWQVIKPSEAEERALYEVDQQTALVVAQRPAPQVTNATWTVVAAENDADLYSGVAAIGSPERWEQLGGAISVLSKETGGITTVGARSERIYETQPRSLENGRLVLAGWFSRHAERYVGGILVAFLLLGLSTRLFLANVGGRNK